MSKLKIGEVIKKLRREKGMTQEQLADIMGVSIPAVSKWESGITYPDITILPSIARLFDVSIDRLMNFNVDLSEEEILSIIEKLEVFIREENIQQYLNECEKYANKYTNNHKLKSNLAALNTMAYVSIRDKNTQDILVDNSIKYLLDIVDNTNDIELKESSLAQLSSQYIMKNEPYKAEEAIKKIYKPACNPDTMLPLIYMQQGKLQEARELMQKNLYMSLMESIGAAGSLGVTYYNCDEYTNEEYVDFDKAERYFRLVLDIKEILEDDKTMYSNYLNLAHIALIKKEEDKCIEYLQTMISYVRKTNLNNYTQISTMWCFNEIKEENTSMKMDIYAMLIKSVEETFSDLNNNKRYLEIVKELKKLGEKNKLN